jgi:hypothetical protein
MPPNRSARKNWRHDRWIADRVLAASVGRRSLAFAP